MREFLLKIEDVFEIKGRGLILAPEIHKNLDLPQRSTVLLIKSTEKLLEAEAVFGTEFIRFLNKEDYQKRVPGITCILKNLSKESVEIGMEVWLK